MSIAHHLALSSALALALATSACGSPAPAAPASAAPVAAPAAAATPEAVVRPATELSPQDRANAISSHLADGKSAIEAKRWDDAISEFDGAIGLDAKNVRAFIGRAFAEMHKGLAAEADGDFAKAIELAAGDTDEASRKLRGGALYNRGLIAEATGDKPRSLEFYKASYDAWPNKTVGEKFDVPATP